jgi:hypothetical protein
LASATPPTGARAAHELRFSASFHSPAITGTSAAAIGASIAHGAAAREEVVVGADVVGGEAMEVVGAEVVVGGVVSLQARTVMATSDPTKTLLPTCSLYRPWG